MAIETSLSEVPAWLNERLSALLTQESPIAPDALRAALQAPSAEAWPLRRVRPGAPWWASWPWLDALDTLGSVAVDGLAPLTGDARQAVLLRLAAHSAAEPELEVRSLPLDFLVGTQLVHLLDGDRELFALIGDETETAVLNGTSEPIHKWCEGRIDILALPKAYDYLRFFCHFVHADDGPFRIVEPSDPRIAWFDCSDEQREFALAHRQPVRALRFAPLGAVVVNAVLVFGGVTFRAEFAIEAGGTVEMVDDDPLGPGEIAG